MKRAGNKRGIALLAIGCVLLLAAGGWFALNRLEDQRAGVQAEQILQKMQQLPESPLDTPVATVDGAEFCGRLLIPAIGVELPVFQEWSNAHLEQAPCRYAGSPEGDDLIIAAHNYKSHFGALRQVQEGDEVMLADAAGREYRYRVCALSVLDGTDVADMLAGDWDFTLFTCTKGGKQRVTVRCRRVDGIK